MILHFNAYSVTLDLILGEELPISTKKLHKGGILISSAGTDIIKKTKTAGLFCCGHVSYETSSNHN